MEAIQSLFELFFNLDQHLRAAAEAYGVWIYLVLFGVLFAETGLVVTPFLPGDSLLLTAGVLAGDGSLDIVVLLAVTLAGPILGDSVNYWIGRSIGQRLCDLGWLIKRDHVDRTAAFFEKHGGKTITIARFFPIVRTFAPFMAGVGRMDYGRFLVFSVGGTVVWVGLFVGAGYLFGQIPWVQENLEIGVMFVLALSLIPAAYHFIERRREAAKQAAETPAASGKPAEHAEPCDEIDEIRHAIEATENTRTRQ